MRFTIDLERGKAAEFLVAKLLLIDGWQVQMVDQRSAYDLWALKNDRMHTFEIKNEDRYADSGNICVEIAQGNNLAPSGISSSEATIWIHTLDNMAVIYRTIDMKDYLRHNPDKLKVRSHGDNNNRMFIVPIEYIQENPWANLLPMGELVNSPVLV